MPVVGPILESRDPEIVVSIFWDIEWIQYRYIRGLTGILLLMGTKSVPNLLLLKESRCFNKLPDMSSVRRTSTMP